MAEFPDTDTVLAAYAAHGSCRKAAAALHAQGWAGSHTWVAAVVKQHDGFTPAPAAEDTPPAPPLVPPAPRPRIVVAASALAGVEVRTVAARHALLRGDVRAAESLLTTVVREVAVIRGTAVAPGDFLTA